MALDRSWFNALIDDDGSNTVGTVWGKDDITNLLNSVDAIFNAHCLNRLSTPLGVANATWTPLTFDVREADPLGMYIGGGTVRVPAAGIYGVSATVVWQAGGGSVRYGSITLNGVMYPPTPTSQAPTVVFLKLVEVVSVPAATGIGLQVWHDAGALSVLNDTRLHVWRIA